jgi:peptidoglycan/xylan/chitin deacetylase (PgdA/CDA1 family)
MHPTEFTGNSSQLDRRFHPVALYLAIVGKAVAAGLWFFADERVAAAWCFFLPDVFVLHALFAPSGHGLCRVHTRFLTPRREVWLTIDDGPDPTDTPRLLDLLERHGARATFFVVGERAARQPGLIAEIRRRGHDIGHHTHTHPAGTFWCAGPSRLNAELDQTLDVLARAGIRPAWFRAPVGIKHLLLGRALAERQLDYVGWSIRSADCWLHSPAQLVAKVAPRLQPGAIILVHEGPSVPDPVRVAGIAQLLEELSRQGYACVIPRAEQLR